MAPRQPIWLTNERRIINPVVRHRWMCRQLVHRRNAQAAAGNFYEDVLGKIFSIRTRDGSELATLAPKVFEVLSDGLGYVEPHWHGVVFDGHKLNLLGRGVVNYKKRVERFRKNHRRTHRTVGRQLYESALFAITAQGVWTLSPYEQGKGWQSLMEGTDVQLPTKHIGIGKDVLEPAEFGSILSTLAQDVLWPAFFGTPKQRSHQNISLVLLHTSLWNDVAGVWNLHANFPNASDIILRELNDTDQLHALAALVDAPVRCLEDVADWAYVQEGQRRARQANVNFAYHCTGETPPLWNEDGLDCGSEDRVRNTIVYDLPPTLPPWVSTPEILNIVAPDKPCTCGHWASLATAFTAVRLFWQHDGSNLEGTLGVPSYVRLYAERLVGSVVQQPTTTGPSTRELLNDSILELTAKGTLCPVCTNLAQKLVEYWKSVQERTAKG